VHLTPDGQAYLFQIGRDGAFDEIFLKEHEEKNERYGAEDRDRHDLSVESIKGLLESGQCRVATFSTRRCWWGGRFSRTVISIRKSGALQCEFFAADLWVSHFDRPSGEIRVVFLVASW
jgi:hypothetical protein